MFSYESFTADRMGLEGTKLHLLAVGKDMVSIHRPVHLKIMLALQYSLTWLIDYCTWRMAFKAPRHLFFRLCWNLLCAYCSKKYQNRLLSKHSYVYSRLCMGTLMITYAQLSPLYLLSTFYIAHMIDYFRPSTTFPYWKWQKAGQGMRLCPSYNNTDVSSSFHPLSGRVRKSV